MKIQFNTDKTIDSAKSHEDFYTLKIAEELKIYESEITRIEVHVSDENGRKDGINDIRCLLEARLEGKQPIAVTCQAETEELALSGALDKLKASLKTIHGRMSNNEKHNHGVK